MRARTPGSLGTRNPEYVPQLTCCSQNSYLWQPINRQPAMRNAVSWQPPAAVPLGVRLRVRAKNVGSQLMTKCGMGTRAWPFLPTARFLSCRSFLGSCLGAGWDRQSCSAVWGWLFPPSVLSQVSDLHCGLEASCACSLFPLCFMETTPPKSHLLLPPPWHITLRWPELTRYRLWASVSRWGKCGCKSSFLTHNWEMVHSCQIVGSS